VGHHGYNAIDGEGDPNSVHLGSTTVQSTYAIGGFDLLSITSGHYKFSCFPIKTAANAANSHPMHGTSRGWVHDHGIYYTWNILFV